MRRMALVVLAVLAAPGAARAADPCVVVARRIAQLKGDDGYQATMQLFAAARLGCEREAGALLDRGAAVDAKDREGMTALARSAQSGKIKVMQLLMGRGANVGARSINGSTPLYYAAEADRTAAVRLLLDHGADPNALDNDGKGAMVYAACRASAPIVGQLIDAGVDVNLRYTHGLTALMWAAGHDASAGVEDVEATLKLLIERGAARDLKDDRGDTAAEIARQLGYERAAKMLQP